MRAITVLALGLLSATRAFAATPNAAAVPGPHEENFAYLSAQNWNTSPTAEAYQAHVIWRDAATGAYGKYIRRQGGDFVDWHIHTQDSRVLVFSGTLILKLEGQPAHEMGAGSYSLIPGKAVHTSECKAGEVCLYYEEQAGPADLTMVDKKIASIV